MEVGIVGQNYLSQGTVKPKVSFSNTDVGSINENVKISDKGQDVLKKENTSGLESLKQFQVAPWAADYMSMVSTELGGKGGVEFGAKVLGQSDYEKAQYAGLAQRELQAVLDEEGISSQAEYHKALVADEDYSAQLRERFLERMMKVNEQLYTKLS
jgi:hypothetical protein